MRLGTELVLVDSAGVAAVGRQAHGGDKEGAGSRLCEGARLRRKGGWGTALPTLDPGIHPPSKVMSHRPFYTASSEIVGLTECSTTTHWL